MIAEITKDEIRVLEKLDKSSRVALVCHDNPDPDAIGPAFALKEYCQSKQVFADILYGGVISHPQNRSLVNVLDIPMKSTASLKDDDLDHDSKSNDDDSDEDTIAEIIKRRYDLVVFLDTSVKGGEGNLSALKGVVPDIVIDHHDSASKFPDSTIIIRERCGATASIVMRLLAKAGVVGTLSPAVATALFIGLQSDTNYMSSGEIEDIDRQANEKLIGIIDFATYTRLMRYDIPDELLRMRKAAYGEYFFRENNLVVLGVGYVKQEFKDLISLIADEVARTEGIQKVVVIGIVKSGGLNQAVSASIRTTADTMNTASFARSVFGSTKGGAKQGAGGAFVPIGELTCNIAEKNPEAFFNMLFEYYKEVVLEAHTKA